MCHLFSRRKQMINFSGTDIILRTTVSGLLMYKIAKVQTSLKRSQFAESETLLILAIDHLREHNDIPKEREEQLVVPHQSQG